MFIFLIKNIKKEREEEEERERRGDCFNVGVVLLC